MKRFAATAACIVVALALLIIVAGAALDPEQRTVDDAAQAGAPGKFVRLRDGLTHYDLAGPDGGPPVVLLSGASVPFYLWDPTREALAASGFRVVRYDYFGRGFSDRPDIRYDLEAFDRQLTDLLDALRIRDRVHVAGCSMGGVIAASFADRHLERVRSVTLVDPAFEAAQNAPWPLRIPGIADFLAIVGARRMATAQLEDFLHPERHPDWVGRYEVQMRYKGFRRSLLETLRGDTLKRPASSFTRLVRGRPPILILWGTADRTAPFAGAAAVRAAYPHAEFHAIEGAAHLPHIEQAALVNSILVTFLTAH